MSEKLKASPQAMSDLVEQIAGTPCVWSGAPESMTQGWFREAGRAEASLIVDVVLRAEWVPADAVAPLLAEKDAEIERLRREDVRVRETALSSIRKAHDDREWALRERDAARAELEVLRRDAIVLPDNVYELLTAFLIGNTWAKTIEDLQVQAGELLGLMRDHWRGPVTEVVSDGD